MSWIPRLLALVMTSVLSLLYLVRNNHEHGYGLDPARYATMPDWWTGWDVAGTRASGHSGSGTESDTAIVTTDTRELDVPLDPAVSIPSWTLAALNNHLYAQALGATFTYFQVDGGLVDGQRPRSAYQPSWDGYCQHRTYGWRPAHFCKMPYVWHTLQTRPEVENLVYIDSDALFRSPDISVHRHLDQLSPQRPFGVLTNRPYDLGPCSGYWFMSRTGGDASHRQAETSSREGSAGSTGTGLIEDFILEWWNEDWKDTSMMWRDQATLRRLIGGQFPGGKVGPPRKSYDDRVLLLDEGNFELKSPDQLFLHVGHKVADRAEQLAALWKWTEYPLEDRVALRRLLKEIDVQRIDPHEITREMPLPGERVFG